MPGRPSYRAGVNRRSESQRLRQASPIRSSASRITNDRPRLAEVVAGSEAGLPPADDHRRRTAPCRAAVSSCSVLRPVSLEER